MANTKISAMTAAASFLAADEFSINEAGVSKKLTGTLLRQAVPLSNGSTVSVATAYAVDTYIAGSMITAAVGIWKVGTLYHCIFDMQKTAAGTATPIITIRMGTLGTIGDAAIQTVTFGAGTAVADTATWEVWVTFRTVGAGTAAVIGSTVRCTHLLAATGMTSTGASGIGIGSNVSAGFDSTSQTKIGVSFNGGAAFSGTNIMVQAYALNI